MQGLRRTPASRAGAALLAALAAACLLAIAWAHESSRASHGGRPHVVLLTTDDQTLRDMAVMPRTRALIGESGTTFRNAYISYPLCCPARATWLTGQYAHNHNVLGNVAPEGGYSALNDSQTLPVWLQASNYRTIHLGKMPNGFGATDQSYVPPGWGPFPANGEFYGYIPDPPSAYYGFKLNENGTPVTYQSSDYQTDIYAEKAVSRIDDHFNSFPDRPLYMETHFFAPHDPALPAVRHIGAFANARLPKDKSFNEKDVRDKPPWLKSVVKRMGSGLRAKVRQRHRNRLESLLAVDEAVEAIVNKLYAEGVLDETYVIFTSDNGYLQGQHRLHQGKFVAYDPSAKVPLLVRGPGIPAGGSSKELVSNVDLVPSILEAAGAIPGVTQDGRSILPFARNTGKRSRRPLLFETGRAVALAEPGAASAGKGKKKPAKRVKNLDLDFTAQLSGRVIKPPKYRAIRTARYLLIKYSDGGRELYDMFRDRLQINSVYSDGRYLAIRKYLLKKLSRLTPCAGAGCNRKLKKPPKPLRKAKKRKGRKGKKKSD